MAGSKHNRILVRRGARAPRVCLLTETFYPVVGGGETHARLLSAELNALGMPTFVLTRRSLPDLLPQECIGPTPVHRVSPANMNRWGKYAMVPFAVRVLSQLRDRYDLIYVCGFRVLGAPAVVAARALGRKCVLRAETIGELSAKYATAYSSLPAPITNACRAAIVRRNVVLRRADAFVSISDPIYDEFTEHGVPAGKIHPIPNGIDPELFRPARIELKRDLRRKLGLPNGILAAYSGKLNRGKGLEHLIRAWSIVVRNRDAHLVLIGSGSNQSLSCEDDLRRLVADLGLESGVTFTGYTQSVHEYLQACDMFVFPTENEAFGIALVEAMSCGLPAVASRVGGVPGIVDHLDNGVLVEPGDPELLAWSVIALLEQPDLRRAIGARARETACRRFSIRAVAEQHFDLFRSLCS